MSADKETKRLSALIREIRGWLYLLPWWQGIAEFTDRSPEHWMTCIRRDLGKRLQHKAPLLHSGVRDREAGIVDDQVVKQQNVDVDDAWPLFLGSAPSHLLLDFENAGEQFLRRLLRIQRDSTIQKPGLGGKFHGFGVVER